MAGKLEQFNSYTNPALTTKGNEVNIRWDNSLIKSKNKHIVGSFSLGKEEMVSENKDTFIPICSYCKDIRNAEDQWEKIETYFTKKYNLTFSHGVCFDCFKKEFQKTK